MLFQFLYIFDSHKNYSGEEPLTIDETRNDADSAPKETLDDSFGRMVDMRIMAKTEVFIKARIIKGYSRRELAKRSGLSHAYISLLERSVKSVGLKSLIQ